MSQSTGMIFRESLISLVLTDIPKQSDCIVLLEGDGFTRIEHSCKLVKMGLAPRLIFSGGITNLEYGSFPYEMCKEKIKLEGLTEKQIIVEESSMHTRQQAENVVELCLINNWNSMILVATHYHQIRAFLTFLKVIQEKNLESKFKIYNSAVISASWFDKELWGSRIELLNEELKKIDMHHLNGHVSDYEFGIKYFKNR